MEDDHRCCEEGPETCQAVHGLQLLLPGGRKDKSMAQLPEVCLLAMQVRGAALTRPCG